MKEKLIEYKNLKKEVKLIECRINKLKNNKVVSDSVRGTSHNFPYIEKSYKIKGIDPKIEKKLESLLEELSKRQQKIMDILLEIEKIIESIPSSRMRIIFMYRYLDDYSWRKIALSVGGTEDSIRKEHDRFLKKIEKNEICPKCPV